MQFTFARDTAIDTISHVARRTKKSSVPILEHILVTAQDQSVTLGGHDGHSSSSGVMAADVVEGGTCAVPGDQFVSIINRMPKGSHITIKFTPSDPQVAISCGRSKYRISTLPIDDFPPLLEPDNPTTMHISGDDIATIFSAPALVIEEDNPSVAAAFAGLYFHADANGNLAGCGIKKSMLVKVSTETKFPKNAPNIVIPRRSIDDISKTAGDHGADFAWSKSVLQVKSGNWTFATKLIDGEFPNYEKIMPPAHEQCLRISADSLYGAIQRLQTVETKRSFVLLRWDGGEISASLNGNGEGGEMIECECVGMKSGQVAVTVSDLMNIIGALAGKTIAFHIAGPQKAFLALSDQNPNALVMQAPIYAGG